METTEQLCKRIGATMPTVKQYARREKISGTLVLMDYGHYVTHYNAEEARQIENYIINRELAKQLRHTHYTMHKLSCITRRAEPTLLKIISSLKIKPYATVGKQAFFDKKSLELIQAENERILQLKKNPKPSDKILKPFPPRPTQEEIQEINREFDPVYPPVSNGYCRKLGMNFTGESK